ncbi:hypothetical protein C2G38_2231474 [Gigaspora rosea]|uniref:Uncharacterized protein n=1 Tax=Gigaspora rosea TaxID=44941 RepID=A0A397TTU5_9GLOM|nr:hypothetical protein C2G38_2231474 [Gigaspora rosea]
MFLIFRSFFVALGVYSVDLEMDPWLRFSFSGFLFVAFVAGVDLGMDLQLRFPGYFTLEVISTITDVDPTSIPVLDFCARGDSIIGKANPFPQTSTAFSTFLTIIVPALCRIGFLPGIP